MRFQDVQRLHASGGNKKWLKGEINVTKVGDKYESDFSWAQNIEATDGVGMEATLTYYFRDDIAIIDKAEIGKQTYDVSYNGEYFKCKPTEPMPADIKDGSVWERKDRRIARMSCIKSAVEYVNGLEISKNVSLETKEKLVTTIAGQFYDWIYKEDENE